MKQGKKTLAIIALLTVALFAAMMTSCASELETQPSSSTAGDETPATTTKAPDETDKPLSLEFGEEMIATAEVQKSREITIRSMSNFVLIKGEGSFSVKYKVSGNNVEAEEKTASSDDNNEVKLEGLSDTYTTLEMTIDVDAPMTLTFTLVHNPGTEGNPYSVAATGTTALSYGEGMFIKIEQSGWYKLSGSEFELTNYTGTVAVSEYQPYLVAGTYGIAAKDKTVQNTMAITAIAAPVGYDEENPLEISDLGNAGGVLFNGTKLYFHFTAPADGVYVFGAGLDGKGGNCRFALSTEDYATYYGRYYEKEWLTCSGGKNYAVHMNADSTVTIAVDYTMSDKMSGSCEVSLNISTPVKLTELGQAESGDLEQKGRAYFAFTAPSDGTYKFNLGNSTADRKSRLQLWSSKLVHDDRTNTDHYEWEKGEDYYAWGNVARKALDAGETIYIVVDSVQNANGKVNVLVDRVTAQPLPEQGWASGTYESVFYDEKLVLDCADRYDPRVTYNDSSAALVYADGVATFEIGGKTYTLELPTEGDGLILSYNKSYGKYTGTLHKYVASDPVTVDKFEGIYKDTDGNEITIFNDGNAIYNDTKYVLGSGATEYKNQRNALILSQDLKVTIGTMGSDGKPASVVVTTRNTNGSFAAVTFDKTDKAVVRPSDVLAGLDTTVKYTGDGFTIYNGSVNDSPYYILEDVTPNVKYRVSMVQITRVDSDGNSPQIQSDRKVFYVELVKEDGVITRIVITDLEDQPVATLVEESKNYTDAPAIKTNGTQQDNSRSDVTTDGVFYLKVNTTGWYTLNGSGEIKIATVDAEDSTKLVVDNNSKKNVTEDGIVVQLTAGTYLQVYGGNFTATYSETDPNANKPGSSADNPYVWDGNEVSLANLLTEQNWFYVSYTPSETGIYLLNFGGNGDSGLNRFHIQYNNTDYGWFYENYEWNMYSETPLELTLTEDQAIVFSIRRGYSTASGKMSIAVKSDDGGQGGESADISGTYTGSGYTITIYENGTLDFTSPEDGAQSGLNWRKEGNSYTFTYISMDADQIATFTISGNTLTLTDWGEGYTLTKEGGEPAADLFSSDVQGFYSYSNEDEGIDYKLQINANDISFDEYGASVVGIAVTKPEEGSDWYSFEWVGSTFKFRISGGNIELVVGEEEPITLTKGEGTITPTVFAEYECGVYTWNSEDGNAKYELTLEKGGLKFQNEDQTTAVQDVVPDFDEDNWVYSFVWDGKTVQFSIARGAVNLKIIVEGQEPVEVRLALQQEEMM